MKQSEFLILYAILKNSSIKEIRSKLSLTSISMTLIDLKKKGFINSKNDITKKGIEALEPYKVNNAIILAAGMSSRFVPISLEKPKGLIKVKREILIERQINQLLSAGIEDITIVVGYKKESFIYLKKKYKKLKIVINPLYHLKNNIESIFLVKKFLKNTFICSCDNYFKVNPFEDYVFESYYSSVKVNHPTNEWYMYDDGKGYIKKVAKVGISGTIMLGHVYWDHTFSKSFKSLIEKHHKIGDYDQELWEQLFADNIKNLPKMYIRVFPKNTIYEFDSLDELRMFDKRFKNNTNSIIIQNICKTLKCKEYEVRDFKVIKEGLTNTSFHFESKGKRYVYRHPGEGTNAIISRFHEKKALEIAKINGIDNTYIYMDENNGWKISSFIKDFKIPNYNSFEDSKKILNVLRKLHKKNLHVDWEFNPWEDACKIERMINKESINKIKEFKKLKENVKCFYFQTKTDGIKKRFCHCDTYKPNWMITRNRAILIDWEYAGEADPGCDIGCYIMDSMWNIKDAIKFIKEYCQDTYDAKKEFHYLTYTALVSYYWFVWALYRESCGCDTGESLNNWRIMANRYSDFLIKNTNKYNINLN